MSSKSCRPIAEKNKNPQHRSAEYSMPRLPDFVLQNRCIHAAGNRGAYEMVHKVISDFIALMYMPLGNFGGCGGAGNKSSASTQPTRVILVLYAL